MPGKKFSSTAFDLGCAFIGAFFVIDTHAETTHSATTEKYAGQPVVQMESITVTATRHAQNPLNVPSTVSVISNERIEEHTVTNIQELIRHEPGVQVPRTTSGVDPFGNLTGFVIRGVGGNRVQMQVDGSRVIESIQDGNRDFVDLSMMKSVEIMRGPGSALWGADAIGGVVAYRTLDPDDLLKGRSFGAKASAGYNSLNNAFSQTALISAQNDSGVQGLIGYTHRKYEEAKLSRARSDGGIWGCARVSMGCDKLNPLDGESHNLLAKLIWRPNASHEIRMIGEYFRSDADIQQMYDKGLISSGRLNGDYPREQTQIRKRLSLEHDWKAKSPFLDNLRWRLSWSPQKREWNGTRYQTTIATGNPYSTAEYRDYNEDFLQLDVQLTSSFNTTGSRHRLTYGLQGDVTETSYWQKRVINNNGAITTSYGVGANFTDTSTRRADVYLQDEILLPDWKLTIIPGARYATYSIDPSLNAGYQIVPGKEPRKIDSHKLIPQLGMMLKMTDIYSLYARYAEGFKMPTAQQLYASLPNGGGAGSSIIPNPGLKPELVKSYEAGIRGKFDQGWFSTGAFYSDYTDFIKNFQPVGPDYTYLNISKVKLWGIEASGEWRFSRNWAVNGKANYQHGKQKDRSQNRYVPFNGASPFNAMLGIKWTQPAWRLSAELYGTFSEKMRRTESSTAFKPDSYSVFDAYLNWRVDKTFRLTASVLNLFNQRYFSYSAANQSRTPPMASVNYTNPLELYTMPGRTFGLNVTADF
ncbi:MAG: TonB-dependent hemoglobin/transferrin/lactoferrin family receptor [Candidatus Accumulibacter sp.]|nr:TonB-dependent hemoglobin/transferrin/lactoferrin family receptor [Accumulibacter sp.]